jgi:hypothetical protein
MPRALLTYRARPPAPATWSTLVARPPARCTAGTTAPLRGRAARAVQRGVARHAAWRGSRPMQCCRGPHVCAPQPWVGSMHHGTWRCGRGVNACDAWHTTGQFAPCGMQTHSTQPALRAPTSSVQTAAVRAEQVWVGARYQRQRDRLGRASPAVARNTACSTYLRSRAHCACVRACARTPVAPQNGSSLQPLQPLQWLHGATGATGATVQPAHGATVQLLELLQPLHRRNAATGVQATCS